jgi:cytochrome oxidase Cu insertion factor (SCO1/SenC/PrrC family)
MKQLLPPARIGRRSRARPFGTAGRSRSLSVRADPAAAGPRPAGWERWSALALPGRSATRLATSIDRHRYRTLTRAERAVNLMGTWSASMTAPTLMQCASAVLAAMTLCQETCPLDTANLVGAARAVTAAGLGDRVAFATITIDPHRDTPARLAAYRDQFAPAPADWRLLTGSPDTLAALWKDLGATGDRLADRQDADLRHQPRRPDLLSWTRTGTSGSSSTARPTWPPVPRCPTRCGVSSTTRAAETSLNRIP